MELPKIPTAPLLKKGEGKGFPPLEKGNLMKDHLYNEYDSGFRQYSFMTLADLTA